MDQQDEQFFASLAGAKSDTPVENESYEVELAKAGGAVASRPASRVSAKAKSDDGETEGQLTVDVYQTPTAIVVESAIAGVKPEDIDINVTPDSIAIHGARHREKTDSDADYLYQECYWGRFGRSIILPQEVDPEGAEVTFKNGILTVRLPKVNKRRSRKLRIKVD
jgi:HSP20 family molecular chaperone IbpA